MSKHTAWVAAEDGWIDDVEGRSVVQYAGCGSHEAEWASPEAKAIALAAPELLEALQRLVDAVDPESTGWDEAVAAIAKAMGEA